VFPKGHYQELRAQGVDAIRKVIAEIEPRLAKNAEALTDWQQFSLLSVESSRCPVWHKPGLLLIGDAAHVMSPVGGVGINYAIQDAVVATKLLNQPLKTGQLSNGDLAKVQSQREWPTKMVQAMQATLQKNVIANVLASTHRPTKAPWQLRLLLKIPFLRDLPSKMIAFGPRRVHLAQ